jgi:polyisoprenyl-phosphate glycosyltransferase
MKKLSIILPTYNESENIFRIYDAIISEITPLKIEYEIIYIDDNSPDGTINIVKELRNNDTNVKYIRMSNRFGDQKCLMAGLEHAIGDVVITMDADLEHPPKYIPTMISEWENGADIVVMKRENTAHNNLFKKWSEIIFYKLLVIISGKQLIYRFSGFALMDNKVVRSLREYKEKDPFLRGLISVVGFNRSELYYTEDKRIAGKTKYLLLDMVRLGFTGITSFSNVPLYFSFYLGIVILVLSLLYSTIILYEALINELVVSGWASIILMVIFFGGVQLISIGLLSIYVSKIFIETKNRPNYIIAESEGINEKYK